MYDAALALKADTPVVHVFGKLSRLNLTQAPRLEGAVTLWMSRVFTVVLPAAVFDIVMLALLLLKNDVDPFATYVLLAVPPSTILVVVVDVAEYVPR